MLIAETCLLLAIRDRLRTAMALGDNACDIELDDQVPTLAREQYYTITSAGTTPGQRHSSSGGVWDLVFSVKVTLYEGVSEVPRDRRRNVFIDRLSGINQKLTTVIGHIHFDYTHILEGARARLVDTDASAGRFVEPFRRFTPDPTVRPVVSDPFNAASGAKGGDPVIALARGVVFSGARFLMELG